jgi:arylsulfatase A-like enzyme/Tfp pilus assembly protein PilF
MRAPVKRHLSWFLLFSATTAFAGTNANRRIPTNVILITIDTVRADHTGPYGAKDVQTPTLDALARDGIVFERAISQVPLTWPSHAVILTGTYPFQNGVQDFTGQPLDPKFVSVAQIFKQHGYATAAVVSAFVLDRSWGLARGFDFYDDAFSPQAFMNRDLGLVDRRANESVDHALSWLKKNPRRPFFFWLHLYDPHSPYDPPEPFRTRYKSNPYDGEIAYADGQLGRLIAWLKQRQLYDRSSIVVLSDHGESLGDHGEKEHGFFIYNSTVHIPLIVKPAAGGGFRPGRVPKPVETTAIPATLLHLAGIKDSFVIQFSSPSLVGKKAESDEGAYSETFYPFSSFGWNPFHALQTDRYQYIEAPEPELYDLVSDPEQKKNIISEQSATAAVLNDKLTKLLQQSPFTPTQGSSGGLGRDAQEKLRALGYVAFRSPVPQDALVRGLPDPKSKLWEFNAILSSEDAFHAGNYAAGKKLLAQVSEKDSQMYIIPFMLGEAGLAEQDWPEAEKEFKRCLELNSNFDQAMTGLSRALIYQQKDEEAQQWARNALKFNPENYRAWYQLGFIQSKTDKDAAIESYLKAISIQENFAPLQRDLGLLYYQQQKYSGAATHLAKAVELGVREPQLFNALGISYSRTNQLAEAIASYKKALDLKPDLAEAHLNLGYAYQRMSRVRDAEREYDMACRLHEKFCELVHPSR